MATENRQQIGPEASAVEAERPALPRRKRKSRRAAANRSQRRRLRFVYFSLASLWGFLIGTVTLLFGFSLGGKRLDLSPVAVVAMSAAVLLAVIGGMIAAKAYRDASRRGGR